MSTVRTIRKQPLLAQIMKAAGGVHARTALEQARAAVASTRDENICAIAAALTRMGEWRDLAAPTRRLLEIAHEIGDRRGAANASWNLGAAYETLGELARITVCDARRVGAYPPRPAPAPKAA